jgi:hypothetical protein
MIVEKRLETSVSEAGDIIASAQRLIEAGVLTDDPELIEAAKLRWKQVWPDEVVDLNVDIYVKDLRKEFANPNPQPPSPPQN